MSKLIPATRQILWWWFVFLTAVIFASAYLTHRSSVEMALGQAEGWKIQSIRENLLIWLSSHRNAETATRGFLITHAETFLDTFQSSLSEAKRSLEDLRNLLNDDAPTLRQMEELAVVGREKEQHMVRLIALSRDNKLDKVTTTQLVSTGKTMMDTIGQIVERVDGTQRERLAAASQRALALKEQASAVALATSALLLGFVGLFFLSASRSLRERSILLEGEREARASAQTALVAEKTALDTAEQANRTKDEFLAIVSHELRTPLNAILGWVAVLKGELVEASDLESGIGAIERNARAQQILIDELLDVTRIASGKIQLELRKVDLPEVTMTAIELLRPTAGLKGVALQGPDGDEHVTVAGAEDRLQQIISNLVSNAIKFTPAGGVVTVWVGRVESWVEATVTDTGQGIDEQFLPRIFDRFIQLDGSTTRTQGGLGLGLSIVRHLVELHGGSVTAESAGLGRGATFRVKLPLVVGDRTTSAPMTDELAGGSQPQPRGTMVGSTDEQPAMGNSQSTAAPEVQRTPVKPSAEATTKPGDASGEDAALPSPEKAGMDEPNLQGVQLLVVDDHADTLDALVRILRGKGALVRTAERTSAALELLRGWRPDVIISDLAMPEEDGYNLIRRIRGLPDEGQRWVPALALTAFARDDDRERALAAGFDDYLAKPADPAELIRKIFHLIRALE